MKLLEAAVEWYKDYHNHPTLKCLVDKIPNKNDIIYEKKDNMYWGEYDDYVSFFYHIPSDQTGFGGSIFTLKMNNGEIVKIKGPWSSNSATMNQHFPPSTEMTITDDPEAWKRGYTFYGAHVMLNFAEQVADMAGVSLLENKYGYSPSLDPIDLVKEFRDGYLVFHSDGTSRVLKSLNELENARDPQQQLLLEEFDRRCRSENARV